MKAISQRAHTELDAIPGRQAMLQRVRELDDAVAARVGAVRRVAGGQLFYLKRAPRKTPSNFSPDET